MLASPNNRQLVNHQADSQSQSQSSTPSQQRLQRQYSPVGHPSAHSPTQSSSPTTPTAPPLSPARSTSAGRTLGDKISALGAKLSRTLGHASVHEQVQERDGAGNTDDDRASTYSEPRYTAGRYSGRARNSVSLTRRDGAGEDVEVMKDRSVSRGREAYSTGRGGAGNMRPAASQAPLSNSNSPARNGGIQQAPSPAPRGREMVANGGVYSTGRGGAGNLRSPSRGKGLGGIEDLTLGLDVVRLVDAADEADVIREYVAMHEGANFSTGRGGAGNITSLGAHGGNAHGTGLAIPMAGRPRARSRSRADESADAARATLSGNEHASANATPPPYSTHAAPTHGGGYQHVQAVSTGRGGAGNIVRNRSRSRSKSRVGERERSKSQSRVRE